MTACSGVTNACVIFSLSFFIPSEAVLALTCALMLLNTDLHGQVGNIYDCKRNE